MYRLPGLILIYLYKGVINIKSNIRIYFKNLDDTLKKPMEEFASFYNISLEKGGYEVEIFPSEKGHIKVTKNKNDVKIFIGDSFKIFRAICILKADKEKESFEKEEIFSLKTLGAMFDGAQKNSLMNMKTLKQMTIILASMGYNMMMLYCEDCYDIEGEPYFGNMRPRYSQSELKEIDAFADSFGIELIPCIQTLGHLKDPIKRPVYKQISDSPDILLVGDDRTYALIDKMISAASKTFKTRRIHIGLDEAWNLGLGKYLKENGYTKQSEIMKFHLKKLYEITQKYNLKPMMWGDMFFRMKSKTDDYYDESVSFDESDKNTLPENMQAVYWDYYHDDVSFYENMIDKTRYLGGELIFAGCAPSNRTFGSYFNKSKHILNTAITACKNKDVKEVIACVWGDDHTESSTFAAIKGLLYFAQRFYGNDFNDDNGDAKMFESAVKADINAFSDIEKIDTADGFNDKSTTNNSLSRVFLYQDIMMGLCDYYIKDFDFAPHYKALKEKLAQNAKNYPSYKNMFEFYENLANVLETKSNLGVKITKAYLENDKAALADYCENVLPRLYKDVKKLRISHRNHFFDEYKPIGWEVLDIRYGGVLMRIDTAIERLSDYLNGKIDKIDELLEKRLPFDGDEIRKGIDYKMICSVTDL